MVQDCLHEIFGSIVLEWIEYNVANHCFSISKKTSGLVGERMPPLMSVLLTEEDANNPLANLGVKLSINSEPTNRESFLKKCSKKENISFIKKFTD